MRGTRTAIGGAAARVSAAAIGASERGFGRAQQQDAAETEVKTTEDYCLLIWAVSGNFQFAGLARLSLTRSISEIKCLTTRK
jgi:hypothetical protein